MGADERLVGNVRDVYRRTKSALQRRREGYDSLFNSVQQSVSQRFMGYMQRRKHKVRRGRAAGGRDPPGLGPRRAREASRLMRPARHHARAPPPRLAPLPRRARFGSTRRTRS